jgi:outer membrane immunogenic protein
MKKIVLACVGLSALTALPALAADLPMKAAPVAPVFSWTGWYGGVNVGYGVGEETARELAVSGAAFPVLGAGTQLYGGTQNLSLNPGGVVGGVQAGYNWQWSTHTVVGIEADFQGSDMRGSVACVVACGTAVTTAPAPAFLANFPVVFAADSFTHKIDWFGTVRGRIGYADGMTLFYLTGGLAYGDVERSGSVVGLTQNPNGSTRNTFNGSLATSTTRVGWTIGAGFEAMLAANSNWSVKGEYLYVDLGNTTDVFNTNFQPGGNPGVGVAATRFDYSSNHDHIIRVGLNYHFNQAVVAKY